MDDDPTEREQGKNFFPAQILADAAGGAGPIFGPSAAGV